MAIRADDINILDATLRITHKSVRPLAYTFCKKPEQVFENFFKLKFYVFRYQRALKEFVKIRHLINLKPNITEEDRVTLSNYQARLKKQKNQWFLFSLKNARKKFFKQNQSRIYCFI